MSLEVFPLLRFSGGVCVQLVFFCKYLAHFISEVILVAWKLSRQQAGAIVEVFSFVFCLSEITYPSLPNGQCLRNLCFINFVIFFSCFKKEDKFCLLIDLTLISIHCCKFFPTFSLTPISHCPLNRQQS